MKKATHGSIQFGNRSPVIARWMLPHQNMLGDSLYPLYIMESGLAEFVDTYSLSATNEHWTPINFEELWVDGYQRTNANPRLTALREEFTFGVEISPEIERRIILLNEVFADGYATPSATGRQLVLKMGSYIDTELARSLHGQLKGKRIRDPFDDAIKREFSRPPRE